MITFKEFMILNEKQSRTGLAHWAYPDGYIRGENPALYFTSIAADAIQKLGPKADEKNVDVKKFKYKNFDMTKE